MAERATFHFKAGDLTISSDATHTDFVSWIVADIKRIGTTIDVALERADVTVETVDSILMTGATSYVPAVLWLFEQRFGDQKALIHSHA